MKAKASVDTSDLQRAAKSLRLTRADMLNIEGNGAKVQINGQKLRVAKDTNATQLSIDSHIVTATNTRVEDEIGAETEYAPNIEYGRRDMPNYPIQPYIRPTAMEDFDQTINAISKTFEMVIKAK